MDRLAFLCICGLTLRSICCMPSGNSYMSNMNNLPMPQNPKPFTNTAKTFNEAQLLPNNANFMPNAFPISNSITDIPSVPVSNIEVTPYISEVVPSLQYGDINMAGDLPIGGTIRVSGCFPVYGTVAVDGSVPSAGTAVVSESFGNQVIDVVNKCASQYFN